MKSKMNMRPWICLALMGLTAVMISMIPNQALAQQTCPTTVNCNQNPLTTCDADKDGFSDYDECKGIAFAGRGSPPALDPNKPDLFVILVKPKSGSLIPTTKTFEFVEGLGISVHQITSSNAASDRTVAKTSTQKAVMITESLDTSTLDVLGQANCGTPNDLDYATVFTKRIQQHVNNVYSPASPPTVLIDLYIKHTIAHEIGHMIRLRSEYDDRYGGYHYNPGDQNIVVMDQSVSYTVSGQSIIFNIGTQFDPDDISGPTKFKLK